MTGFHVVEILASPAVGMVAGILGLATAAAWFRDRRRGWQLVVIGCLFFFLQRLAVMCG
jgi:hypothetical protein